MCNGTSLNLFFASWLSRKLWIKNLEKLNNVEELRAWNEYSAPMAAMDNKSGICSKFFSTLSVGMCTNGKLYLVIIWLRTNSEQRPGIVECFWLCEIGIFLNRSSCLERKNCDRSLVGESSESGEWFELFVPGESVKPMWLETVGNSFSIGAFMNSNSQSSLTLWFSAVGPFESLLSGLVTELLLKMLLSGVKSNACDWSLFWTTSGTDELVDWLWLDDCSLSP
ncbi:hypothetical protein OGAPHI_005727 [Ogataea philodendri]|uniref:Uncharacterized protein n=1 Tax=Ogataea philodendri TaxID=1378263 RepID=A0A9P8NZB8_9ASCO|nr:uncharacterized protein OGAPHI_005727 [Ogataea philodendri]KAH3662475.1 hypothetical protein OGAPHI_005727 [Ogataea philodendri]